MAKTEDALRSLKVFNTYEVLKRFNTNVRQAVAVEFVGADTTPGGHSARVRVWSPYFKTNPDSAWYNHYKKTFFLHGVNRKQAMAKALAWAEKEYGIKEWGTCPMDRQTKIPLDIRKRALKAAKNATAT